MYKLTEERYERLSQYYKNVRFGKHFVIMRNRPKSVKFSTYKMMWITENPNNKKVRKFFEKVLDKLFRMWYNRHNEREVI